MDIGEIRKVIMDMAAPLANAQGLEIWGLEVLDGPRLLVRLFVEVPLADGTREESASIGQCEEISRQLELAVDVGNYIDRAWVLEVSSPGLERIFFNLEQMRPYIGDVVDARLYESPENSPVTRKRWRGILREVAGNSFWIEPCAVDEDGEVIRENLPPCRIDWPNARGVHRVHLFKTPRKPGGKRKSG